MSWPFRNPWKPDLPCPSGFLPYGLVRCRVSWADFFETPENLIRLARQVFSLMALLGVGSHVLAPGTWDSPGKNTGVGCHFLLQCMKVKSGSEVAQSCPTLSDLMLCSLPVSFVHGIFQARVLECSAIAFSEPWPLGPCYFSCLSHPLISQPVEERAMYYLSVYPQSLIWCLALVGKSFNDS